MGTVCLLTATARTNQASNRKAHKMWLMHRPGDDKTAQWSPGGCSPDCPALFLSVVNGNEDRGGRKISACCFPARGLSRASNKSRCFPKGNRVEEVLAHECYFREHFMMACFKELHF
ncbi:hypothetical protein CDAR_8371 [Caerostris darwini]|uniref:Uncharacterized protein n=1 Tax=Caerostris darwini TaxID=1538125 RepID=A0AAV4WT78_9ARAC|nr:hypothetical protein CDAR_8371 [Caerostris darwini]